MQDPNALTEGGCLCGAVRFTVAGRLTGALFCHCRMCQRACGSAFSLNVVYARDRLELSGTEPRWYASSEIAERGFCPTCGTPLFMRYSVPEWRNWIAVASGAHDQPECVPAERHFGVESQLPCIHLDDGLPRTSYPDTFLDDVAAGDNEAYQALPRSDD